MKHVMGKKLKLKIEVDLEDVTAEDVEQMRISQRSWGWTTMCRRANALKKRVTYFFYHS